MSEPLYYNVGSEKISAERGVKLPEDETKWSQKITDHVASDIPELSKYPTEIYVDEKDAKKGYAKGRIVIGNKLVAPVIIKDFKLLPIDVFIHDGEFYQINEKNVDKFMMDKSLGAETVDKKESRGETGELQHTSRPPYSAYTHRNQGYKHSSLNLSYIERDDLEKFENLLKSDPVLSYKVASKRKGILHDLKKIATDLPEEKTGIERIKDIAQKENWELNVIQLSKTANDKYVLYTSSDKCPIAYNEKEVTASEARKIVGAKNFQKVASGEPYGTVMGRGRMSINLPKELANVRSEEIEKFGHYDAITKNNNIVRGFLIPEVYDYGMRKKAGMKLFINPEVYSMQEKIAGKKVMSGPPQEIPSGEIREGITGTFFFKYGSSRAAMTPFHVTSFPLISGEQTEFEAITVDGEPVHFTVLPGLASAAPGEKRGHYLIPSIWQFVNVGSYNEPLAESPNEVVKTAMADTDDKRLEVLWDGVYFQFIGPQVENISQQVQDLDPMKARFLLTAFGVPPDYADQLLKKAKSQGYARFQADIKPAGQYVVETNRVNYRDGSRDTKYASDQEMNDHVNYIVSKIREKGPWVKLAAEFENPETVDDVLSLDFVNPQNLNDFINSIDNFKDTRNKLAKLLIATRLGIKQVAPESVKTAMNNITEVIEDLEVLGSVIKNEAKKQ